MLFGVVGPLTARYLPELVERFGGGLEIVVLAEPIPADGITQFNANAQQLGILAVVAVAGAALVFDANREMSIFLRTRVSVTEILRPRFVVNSLGQSRALVIGAGIALVETWVLLGSIPLGPFMAGVALNVLYLVFAVADGLGRFDRSDGAGDGAGDHRIAHPPRHPQHRAANRRLVALSATGFAR